jgi:hypothetical protein
MNYALNAKIQEQELNKLLEFAQSENHEYWHYRLKKLLKEYFKEIGQDVRYCILVMLAAIGLLKINLTKEEALEILKTLPEIDKRCLAPGSNRIN